MNCHDVGGPPARPMRLRRAATDAMGTKHTRPGESGLAGGAVAATVHVQVAVDGDAAPAPDVIEHWARAAAGPVDAELTVRVAGADEASELNRRFRSRQEATNVLSFPAGAGGGWPESAGAPERLGDVLVCADVVDREARAQGKPLDAHFAHMVVHGVLHLRGYDHAEPAQAETMEDEERRVLAGLGFPDPYAPPAPARGRAAPP